MADQIERLRKLPGKTDPLSRAALKEGSRRGVRGPLEQIAITKRKAKESQARQNTLLAERKREETLKLAEEKSEIARRKALAKRGNPLRRGSLIT